MKQLIELLDKLIDVPKEWLEGVKDKTGSEVEVLDIEPLPCSSYEELREAWGKALEWGEALDITMTVMLAQVASTMLLEDQLWIRIIGRAGTAKTTLCEALSINRQYVFALAKMTGLHSGFRGDDGEDTSLIPKMKNKTTIANEADTLLKAPNLNEQLSEWRDLFSGKTRAHYRNGKQVEYAGLRTGVIWAGTPIIRELNRSAAGDRFLDVIIQDKITQTEEKNLARKILKQSRKSMVLASNCDVNSQLNPGKLFAYQKTSGYINYLRENFNTVIPLIEENSYAELDQDCEQLGKLVAIMRTRPSGRDEEATEPEFHIRLSNQLLKLALCLAFAMNKERVDEEVMSRVARVAKDTSYGDTYKVCKALLVGPLESRGIKFGHSHPEGVTKAIRVLMAIGAIRGESPTSSSGVIGRKVIYHLTLQTKNLLGKLQSLLGTEL